MAELTLITSTKPTRLSKEYNLDGDNLIKTQGGLLSQGTVEIKKINAVQCLANIISGLTPDQALTFGIPKNPEAHNISSRALRTTTETITRTEADFKWPSGPAVMMLDYDPDEGNDALSAEELLAKIVAAIPEIKGVQVLWTTSSSSHICLVIGKDLTGLRGQRLYLIVDHGVDIPRAAKNLTARLWLQGDGHIKISSAGTLLERTLVDGTVFQASRLDFAAGAATGAGLEQRRGVPIILNEAGSVSIDSQEAFTDLSDAEQINLDRMKTDARTAAAREAAVVREAWQKKRCAESLSASSDSESQSENPEDLERMLDGGELSPGIILFVELDVNSNNFKPISVDDICNEPDKHDGCRTLDPIEPSYKNHRPVGKIFVQKNGVNLHSFARGGQNWTLHGSISKIPLIEGPIALTTQLLLNVMKEKGFFYDYGDGLAAIQSGRLLILDESAFDFALAPRIHITKSFKDGTRSIDPSPRMLKHVISIKQTRGLPKLAGLSDVPIVRKDGTIVTTSGYDEMTGIYVLLADPAMGDIPEEPTSDEVLEAISTIWQPVEAFPYVDTSSRGAALAAMITSVLIQNFPTAPAFLSEGPVRGAGKTLLMQTITALGAGRSIGVTPMPRTGDEAEMQKTITSAVHPDHGANALIFDNVSGTISSDALAALITSETFTGRILGSSRLLLDVPARLLVGVTGTNVELDPDLGRRFLSWRLDPNCEVAFTREFDFDPVQRVLDQRSAIVAAILTLVRAAHLEDFDAPPAFGSFPAWDAVVRRAVLHATHLRPDLFADPVKATIERVKSNEAAQDHHSFVNALEGCFGDQPFESRDVQTILRGSSVLLEGPEVDLADTFKDLGRRTDDISTRSIGRYLHANRDRWSAHLVLRSRNTGRSCRWWVEGAAASEEAPKVQLVS